MAATDRPGVVFRQEALDNYARLDREDSAPPFDVARLRPRWWSFLAGAACLAVLALAGLLYQVEQGPKGVLVGIEDDNVVVGLSDTPPDLVGESIVLTLPDGAEIEGTATDSQQVTGNGATGTMLLVELASPGAATGYDGESVTVNTGRTGLLIAVFGDRGGDGS
ncbi:hypothetical protein [Glycomyces harbinensis]|uniref:Uncharacterized protein n=1 Tax=Glycomyces harbinensis TaxID=58114 RepID=A0A1G7DCE7_9ACTN|nr:hypothetical protein [Glycomyces harbinensis]SDE49149.1 hypothetical protein SAMN05216270_12417 [Glycomyces harbinensis]